MRKKFLILAECIYGIGGGQLYVRDKYLFLKNNGWDVFIFSFSDGNSIMIEELRNFEKNVIIQLKYYPFLLKKKIQERVIDDIISMISIEEDAEIIIESHALTTSFWGEMIAKALNCKHFIHLLHETFYNMHSSFLDFLYFKLKRKELAGIVEESLGLLFENYKKIEENEKLFLTAAFTFPVGDVDNHIVDNISKKEINIGCISRLQKPYIKTMIDEIIRFANKYRNKNIQMVIVGSSPYKKTIQDIINKINPIKNISLILTGSLYPIPKKLFNLIDVFIGTSGAGLLTANEGALTMIIETFSHKPLGLLGYNTQEILYSNSELRTSISTMLEKIFIKKEINKKEIKVINEIKGDKIYCLKEFKHHLDFINSSNKSKEYYIISLKEIGFKNLVKKYFIQIAGLKGYDKLLKVFLYLNSLRINFKLLGKKSKKCNS